MDEYIERTEELMGAKMDEWDKKQNDKDLLQALRRLKVETGSLACLGCGYEHDCGAHGCAILRKVEEQIVGEADCAFCLPGGFCSRNSKPAANAYRENEASVEIGENVKFSEMTPGKSIEWYKRFMAWRAGQAVQAVIEKGNLFIIEGTETIAWKVEIYTRRNTNDRCTH